MWIQGGWGTGNVLISCEAKGVRPQWSVSVHCGTPLFRSVRGVPMSTGPPHHDKVTGPRVRGGVEGGRGGTAPGWIQVRVRPRPLARALDCPVFLSPPPPSCTPFLSLGRLCQLSPPPPPRAVQATQKGGGLAPWVWMRTTPRPPSDFWLKAPLGGAGVPPAHGSVRRS